MILIHNAKVFWQKLQPLETRSIEIIEQVFNNVGDIGFYQIRCPKPYNTWNESIEFEIANPLNKLKAYDIALGKAEAFATVINHLRGLINYSHKHYTSKKVAVKIKPVRPNNFIIGIPMRIPKSVKQEILTHIGHRINTKELTDENKAEWINIFSRISIQRYAKNRSSANNWLKHHNIYLDIVPKNHNDMVFDIICKFIVLYTNQVFDEIKANNIKELYIAANNLDGIFIT